MTLAMISLAVTAAYVGLAHHDADAASSAGPAYIVLIVALWWLGYARPHRERHDA